MYHFSARSLTTRITVAISLLAMLAIAGLAAFALLAALKMDEAALHKQRVLVRNGLSGLMASVPREQESVAIWDDAVLHVATRDRPWLAKNFGGWMHRFFGHDRAYIMDADGRLIFAADGGKAVEPTAFAGDETDVREIVARLREKALTRLEPNGQLMPVPRAALSSSDLREIGGRPAVLSARPILPHSDGVSVSEGSEYIFVALKFLDGATMEQLAHHALVPGLHYEPAGEAEPLRASTPLVTVDGHTLGHFVWSPDRPGITLAGQIAPWASLALIVTLGIGLYLARSLRRASTELQMSESRARHLAYHDVLTGLPNRALFEERLERILDSVWRGTCEAGLLFLDLDRFKEVNDTLGHRAGDELMRQAASRLGKVVGGAGTVARVGGDEFAVVLAEKNALEAARQMSERLLSALDAPFKLGADLVHVGLSIGVATAPAAAEDRQELLRKADIALYAAKKRGRGRYQIFSEDMDDIVKQRRLVEADLRKALARGDELELEYQPFYSVDGALTGAEALLRWNHPVHKSISPAFLVTIAEESGLIRQIGKWALHEACRMAARVPVPWVAVNVSPVQLRDTGFARCCLDIIASHGIEPNRIQVEITETVLIDNPEVASASLRMLRTGGVRVALDDFGTGYASMSYLRKYPLDRLKIDRTFVRAMCEGEEGRAIVAAMIDMARALKLKVTAEGVETADQRDLLRQMGCDEMQGFLFSRPVSAARFAQLFFPASPGARPERRATGPT